MKISKEELLHIVELSNLKISDDEVDRYLKNLEDIVEFANLTLMVLWLFLICSVLFIGWDYGFQQLI